MRQMNWILGLLETIMFFVFIDLISFMGGSVDLSI